MAKTGTFLKQLGTLGFSILLDPRKQHPDTIVSYTWNKGIGLIFCTSTLNYIDLNRWKFQLHCINTFYRIIWKVNECFFCAPCKWSEHSPSVRFFSLCLVFQIAPSFIPIIWKQHITRDVQLQGLLTISSAKFSTVLFMQVITKRLGCINYDTYLFLVETNSFLVSFRSKYLSWENSP